MMFPLHTYGEREYFTALSGDAIIRSVEVHYPYRKMTSAGGRALLGRQPAVNDQLAAGDKGGLIGSQVQDPIGHVLRLAEPPEGVAGHTPLASLRTRQHPSRQMTPGWTELHRMPCRAYCMAVALAKRRTAALEAP